MSGDFESWDNSPNIRSSHTAPGGVHRAYESRERRKRQLLRFALICFAVSIGLLAWVFLR